MQLASLLLGILDKQWARLLFSSQSLLSSRVERHQANVHPTIHVERGRLT